MATTEELKKRMAANSAAWHTAATQEEKDRLHAENQSLASQIGNMSYDSASGVWSGTENAASGTGPAGGWSSSGYSSLNQTSNPVVSKENYIKELENQRAYAAANPTVTQTPTSEELYGKYSSIVDGTLGGLGSRSSAGYVTMDGNHAQKAASQYGATVTPITYGDYEGGWSVTGVDRGTAPAGNSGADWDLMTDGDFAIIQQLKQQYEAAKAAGDTEAMNAAHLEAERIRGRYNYSGGADGSMYLTYGALAGYGTEGSGSGLANAYASALGSGSGGSSSSYYTTGGGSGDDLSEYLKQMYGAKTDAAVAELTAAYQQNVAALNRAAAGLEEQYQSARNQTAGASELAARNFNEYAAAYGLNSGTGGQAELARNVTLQNNLNSLNAEEANAYAELELAKANAQSEYNLAVSQAQATGEYELAAALYQEQIRVQEQLAARQQALLEQSRWEQQLQLEQGSAQQSQLAAYGEAYLEQGVMPSDAMLVAMGITRADAQAYISAMAAANVTGSTKTSGSRSSSVGSGTIGTSDYTGLFSAAKESGYPKSFISNNYKSYGFTSSTGLYDEYQGWSEETEAKEQAKTTRYNGAVEDYQRLIANGATDAELRSELDGIIADLERYGYSEAELISLLNKMGFAVTAN